MQTPVEQDLGYAGKYLRDYKPVNNVNVVTNRAFGRARVIQISSAVIVQQKKFPDVSFWQGDINWDLMRQFTDAVIIRAGQNTWPDSKFARNWSEAKRVGMRRGLYWFYDDRASPGNQAQLLIDLIGSDLPEMEIFADWEIVYGGRWQGLPNVVSFMEAIEGDLAAVTVGMYTGFYFMREHSNPVTNIFQYNYLEKRPLWLPWYADSSIVQIPAPWAGVEPGLTHWQWGTPAVQWGQQSAELDMNYANMSSEEFDQRYRGVSTETPPPNGETMLNYKVVWPNGVARRSAATTVNSGSGFSPYPVDTVVEVIRDNLPDLTFPDDPHKKWVEFADGLYGASVYPDSAGVPQIRMEKIVEPVPGPEPTPELPTLRVTIDGGEHYETQVVEIKPKA